MASALCCTSEQPGRAGSPELPNVRVSKSTTANLPLLPKDSISPNSRFTSAQSEDLLELRQIFSSVEDGASDPAPLTAARKHHRSRPSIISLRSLHKMTSMRSIIRRKFSKDLPRTGGSGTSKQKSKSKLVGRDNDTVVKHGKKCAEENVKLTKDDLRRDLLSDKKPEQGGYDSDAQMLDDVARNLRKKSPGTRPSIHSIEWNPSSGSKATSSSSAQSRHPAAVNQKMQPYKITKPQTVSFSSKIAQVFSSPNLRAEDAGRDRKLRRSHSAASMSLPKPSPLSPIRLPSLKNHDDDGVPWSEVMSESLRLSQFPSPPRDTIPGQSKTISNVLDRNDATAVTGDTCQNALSTTCRTSENQNTSALPRAIGIRIQQPTSIATPRPSTSVRDFLESVQSEEVNTPEGDDGDENPRSSVHLYSMRISHHLRSGSLLSWDQLAMSSEVSNPLRPFKERTSSYQSSYSQLQQQPSRHERHTSSSGFASSKVPSKWGKVISGDPELRIDAASSTYSSRPQSPPDSLIDLPRGGSYNQAVTTLSIDPRQPRRSNSFQSDNEDTPRAPRKYGSLGEDFLHEASANTLTLCPSAPPTRKNSVAETKKSKFHEEFSPSPPRKKVAPASSLMKLLPKRLSMRSQSEANLKPDGLESSKDGPSDALQVHNDRVRRQSVSMVSLQAEQNALAKSKEPHQLWSDALKAHQKEKSSLFLPQNKNLAVSSFFRERSASINSRRLSTFSEIDPLATPIAKRLSVPLLDSTIFEGDSSKRTSVASCGPALPGPSNGVADAFERQGDGPAVVGAWGRYPSHTRDNRTLSAGKDDNVDTRDFALEAAIQFAEGSVENDHDIVNQRRQIMSPFSILGDRKKKRRIGSGGQVSKSHSMTFGRKTIKEYYAGIFKSSSSEFRQHGRGHRSSITSGGHLENPELELLPDIFLPSNRDGVSDRKPSIVSKNTTTRLPADGSNSNLRLRRNSSAPNMREMASLHQVIQTNGSSEDSQDSARLWSMYYENCVPSFPRLSADLLENTTCPPRLSLDSRRSNMHSMAMPPRARHARNFSQVSKFSYASRNSAQASLVGEDNAKEDKDGEAKSLVSVRQSTMDLMARFREEEIAEREKVLKLGRTESRRGAVVAE